MWAPEHVTYVCGFMFSPPNRDGERRVVLIRKNRPEWQKGRLNGVGGKVEDTDSSPGAAMVREFLEETGVQTSTDDWRVITLYKGPGYDVVFYKGIRDIYDDDVTYEVVSKTDEQVTVVWANYLPNDTIHNLRWLIPLALDPSVAHSKTIVVSE